MKLSSINESSRRDFLKSIVGLAMSIDGVTKDAAIKFAKKALIGNKFQLIIDYEYDFYKDMAPSTVEGDWLRFKNFYKTILRMLNNDDERIFMRPSGDSLQFLVDVKIEDALRIAKSKTEYEVDGDGTRWMTTYVHSAGEDDTFVDISNDPDTTLSNLSNLLQIWWEKYGKHFPDPYMSERFANILRSKGLDPIRPYLKEIGEEGYNTAEARKYHTRSNELERWEKPKYDKYDDYLMSQMAHESGIGESKK